MQTLVDVNNLYRFPSLVKSLTQSSGPTAQLDLRFALDKSLTAYRGPTPSFSRASTGSYFDGSGVLRYANVNLTLYSEDFSNAYWVKSNATVSTNQAVSPDGKTTADLLYGSSTGAARGIYYGSPPAKTISIYAKSSGKNWVALTDSSAATSAWFNLSTGTVGTVGAGYTAAIQNVGNGWYRCSFTKSSDFSYFQILVADADNTLNFTANGTDGIFIWGAQSEQSSTVGTYCPTTSSANSAPRFDHTFNGTSWVSRGLLVEEQRTNVVLQSGFQSGWTGNSATLTANSASCPDGTNSAMLLVPSSGGSFRAAYQSISGVNCLSVYAKASGKNHLGIVNAGGTAMAAWFNLSTGEVGTVVANYTATITSVGSGWYRCSLFSSLANYTIAQFCVTDANGSNSVTVNGSDGILLYGAQAESGSFSTSLIPTTTASATRSADVCQITGSDFSGFWNGTEGSIAAEYDLYSPSVGSAQGEAFLWQVDDGTNNNRILVAGTSGSGASNKNRYAIIIGASPQVFIDNQVVPANVSVYSSATWKLNDAAFYSGSNGLFDTSTAIPTGQSNLRIGQRTGDYYLNGHIARLRYFNKRLPNATLQLLSDPDPTLNLQFALNKTLTPVAGPAPSFSRASTGTYFNASGVLTSASINTPRFDHVYSGGQWVSRGLLLEEQRTNLIQYSDISTDWIAANATKSSTSETYSPDGGNNAKKLVENSANSVHGINANYLTISPALTNGLTYTASCFVKSGSRTKIMIVSGTGRLVITTKFDLNNSSVISSSATSSSITNAGNGWFRISATGSPTSSGDSQFSIYILDDSGNETYTGNGSGSIYLWGFQVEQASFPTSYIPTTSSSVVRSADVCQITGTSFNWMWNQGEGSVVAEYDRIASASVISGGFPFVWESYSDSNNKMSFLVESTGKETFYGAQAGATNWSIDNSVTFPANTTGKVSGAYKVNDIAVSTNGSSVATDGTANIPVTSSIVIGNRGSGSNLYLNGHIAKLIYYPARLTNTKLQQLST